jgi:hypothetical protein
MQHVPTYQFEPDTDHFKNIKKLQTGTLKCNECLFQYVPRQWKGINCKQSTRWQHLSRLKASAFFSLHFFSYYETQQLILGTGTAICWVTEPHWNSQT